MMFEVGSLTVVDDADLNGWQMINGAWYYYEDGSYVCDETKTIDGKDYYFGWNGELQIGVIRISGERPYLTDSNGAIIKHAKGWYQSPETKDWYYFFEDNRIASSETVADKGKQYYFDWQGIMQTGSFVVSIWNEEEEDYDDVFADEVDDREYVTLDIDGEDEEEQTEEVTEEVTEEATEETTTVEVELPTFQLKLVAPIIAGLLPEAKVEKKVETIYGIKVVKGVNQTCIWKILKKVCENKDAEGTLVTNQLKETYPEAFFGAVRCLVSKKRINYINSIIEA